MPKWLPDSKPAWWDQIVRFGRNPYKTVIGFVATFIASGFLVAGELVLRQIRTAFDALSLGFDAIRNGLEAVILAWAAGNELLILAWQRMVLGFLGTSVFTPVIVSVFAIALLVVQSWLLYRGVLYFADYVPYLEGILK